jgi:hypothetical protein
MSASSVKASASPTASPVLCPLSKYRHTCAAAAHTLAEDTPCTERVAEIGGGGSLREEEEEDDEVEGAPSCSLT